MTRVALLIAVTLIGQAGTDSKVPPIGPHGVGAVTIGADAQTVYEAFAADRRSLVDLAHEGQLSPALFLRFGSLTQRDGIVAELAPERGQMVVWRVQVRDPAFKTLKGIGVGSTVGQLRAAYKPGQVIAGEGAVALGVDELSASFVLDQKGPESARLAGVRTAADVPDAARIVSVLLTRNEPPDAALRVTDQDLKSVTVAMTREGLCGSALPDPQDVAQCPTYSVTLTGDGTVRYEGRVGVRTLGARTHQVSAEEVRALVDEFMAARFFTLRERYDSVPLPDGLVHVQFHGVRTVLTLSVGGKKKTVTDFYGTPVSVLRLGRRVDEVADSRRYTGRRD
jgi:hypothetical protein